MDTVSHALESNNGWLIAILIVVMTIIIILGARNGLLKIRTDKVRIGKDSITPEILEQKIQHARALEQKVMNHQTDWVKIAVNAFYRRVPRADDYNEFRGRFLIEKCLNEIVDWIIQNHIEDKKTYIELKQELIWNLLLAYTEKEELRSDEFKQEVYDYIEYIIKNLVRIRKQYNNENKGGITL